MAGYNEKVYVLTGDHNDLIAGLWRCREAPGELTSFLLEISSKWSVFQEQITPKLNKLSLIYWCTELYKNQSF